MRSLLFLLLPAVALAQESQLRLVRETNALPPTQQQAALHAPEGFSVQLFASEPMINKPINIAFDARGRLWVSSTVEYPYAAAKDRWSDPQGTHVKGSRDAIKILEDTDGNGQADKVIDFADGLNIPTGVLPWHKPEHKDGCIAWSIPNIWYFADTDGDGKADLREVLFGPLGYEKDTHGMCSSFRLGLDGWVYATHGFNNTSHLKAKDGSKLDLHSGNVFRFRPDGSRVELYAAGQVNPFGLCWDRYNNLYSADCHSNPVTQLIRGAQYPSFGKPHDGLGFGPAMCEHSHGSTGLCGIVYIDGGVWGPEWDNHLFLGNCVTSKVNHDLITFTGSTPRANEKPDFITSDDPWFRPVDLQLGPDSALYIADFYNKIIGHYEVPLDHPERDRERGRIWRVVKHGSTTPLKPLDFSSNVTERAIDIIAQGHPVRTRLAIQKLQTLTKPGNFSRPMDDRTSALFQWGNPMLSQVSVPQPPRTDSAETKVVWLRQATARGASSTEWRSTALAWMQDKSAEVQCAVADAFQAHPGADSAPALLQCWDSAPANDLRLRHHLRLALREHLKDPAILASLAQTTNRPLITELAKSVPTPHAAAFLLAEWKSATSSAMNGDWLGTIARNGTPAVIDNLVQTARERTPANVDAVSAIYNALLERGSKPPVVLLAWATQIAESLLNQDSAVESTWVNIPSGNSESPWGLQQRKCADGTEATLISSLNPELKSPEKLTGILRSQTFAAPAKFSFWLCGHQGLPKGEANRKNIVRLVDGNGQGLHQAYPPRNDIAQRIDWDLSPFQGKPVRLEIVDGDNGNAYAWLAVGRFEPAVLSTSTFDAANTRQKQLKTLATLLRTTAPIGLRDKLSAFLPRPPAIAPVKPRPELDALIQQRVAAFAKAMPDTAKGESLYTAHCSACHTLGGKGGLIGPQLDGIGNRGSARLIEDILDPNRNVDTHFHLHQMKLRDGSTASGFVRGQVGQVVILVDALGNEQRIAKDDITEDTDLPQSLMPPIFAQSIPEESFHDLIAWLLKK